MWIYAGTAHKGKCKACLRDIVWVRTERGASAPIDAPLDLLDHKEVVKEGSGSPVKLTLSRIDQAKCHFVTCPFGERFKRDKQAKKAEPEQGDLWTDSKL